MRDKEKKQRGAKKFNLLRNYLTLNKVISPYHHELPLVHHFVPIGVKHVESDSEACVRLWNMKRIKVHCLHIFEILLKSHIYSQILTSQNAEQEEILGVTNCSCKKNKEINLST